MSRMNQTSPFRKGKKGAKAIKAEGLHAAWPEGADAPLAP